MDLASLAALTADTFTRIHEEEFLGDPVANSRLRVEVVAPEMVGEAATMVLVTPWTLNGMIFCDDRPFPTALDLDARKLPVFENTLEPIGRYRSVNLLSDVSTLDGPAAARRVAESLAPLFRSAVRRGLDLADVPDPDRRRLLRGG